MRTHANYCPHCGEPVVPTRGRNIAGHYTPTGKPCRASIGHGEHGLIGIAFLETLTGPPPQDAA